MCGIYGLLSSRAVAGTPSDEYVQLVDRFLDETDPVALSRLLEDASAVDRVVDRLEAIRTSFGQWTSRGAFLALLDDPSLAERLSASVERLRARQVEFERWSDGGGVARQAHRETLNRWITACKDVVWQVRKDVLESLPAVSDLVGGKHGVALARAYELNLVLRSLDRLEVRGRDSAGIAAFVRFPDAASLQRFLDGDGRGGSWSDQVAAREDPRFGHGTVVRPPGAPETLLFAFKVASEVGKMGDNVAFLRDAITSDAMFQACIAHPDIELQCLAHTRWASNGVISLPNCHPVDSTVTSEGDVVSYGRGRFVAVLNGDIDNYQDLVRQYVRAYDSDLDPAITTDAKIIPVVVSHFYQKVGNLEEAFRLACQEFEGSMAIGLMAAERPGEFFFAQKGSGQGLFFGVSGESVAVASEMYGVVELTPSYVKAEGERTKEGEIFRLRSEPQAVRIELLSGAEFGSVPSSRVQTAEITTRDINRGEHPHFFVKEITESVESVRNTLRGKFEISDRGGVRFLLGPDVLPVELVAGLRDGRVRRIGLVGQGTAAVAAQGVAHLLERALESSPHPIKIFADKAAEFSAYRLQADMSDTLLVAVSQSGTTTDTNRTVDMARQRGAWILSIVNRRNSDLVYKSHGVLYTSDGRDIEMSVASTKAFYAQNVAGQVLALALADSLGTLSPETLKREVEDLRGLPDALQMTLAVGEEIAELAGAYALRRRYWAVVGSGAAKIAADEVRIKLSELCYKSIAVDFLEDKKHIDLSSEPLIIVCAVGQPDEVVSDAAKEVAIFKAHSAIPIVITEEGQTAFDPYAMGVIRLPAYDGSLGYLPATMAGHLFGYHAAASMDSVADRLRRLRGAVVRQQEARGYEEDAAGDILQLLSQSMVEPVAELEDLLADGRLDGTLAAGTAVRLSHVVQLVLGRLPIDGFARQYQDGGGVIDAVLSILSDAVSELSRPIDAIKHQAKTVTVGISRGEATPEVGPLESVFAECGLELDDLLESQRALLHALDPLVASIEGVTVYDLTALDALGRPTEETRISVARKTGCSAGIASRHEVERPLSGNKWAVVKRREAFLGYGQSDGRRLLIVPVLRESTDGHIVLYHLQLQSSGDRETRLRALRARPRFFDRLRAAVTERNLDWDPSLIDAVDNETLFFQAPERVAEQLAHAHV